MLKSGLDLLAKGCRGRHGGKAIFAFYSPIDSVSSVWVVNGVGCGKHKKVFRLRVLIYGTSNQLFAENTSSELSKRDSGLEKRILRYHPRAGESARGPVGYGSQPCSRVAKFCSKTAGDSDGLEMGGEVAEEGGFVGEAHAADGVALSEDFKNYFN